MQDEFFVIRMERCAEQTASMDSINESDALNRLKRDIMIDFAISAPAVNDDIS